MKPPGISRSSAPTAAIDTLPRARTPGACVITARSPARAPYAAAEAAVFPVDAHTIPAAPSSTALETATVIPRSLKEPVGFAPSHLSHSSIP